MVALTASLMSCSGPDAPDPAAAPALSSVPTAPDPEAQAILKLQDAATQALRENRLYSPAGNNAVEYYLSLRDKQPKNIEVANALTDLTPYAIIASEQSIQREDFPEAKRLFGLLTKVDPNTPALPRLKKILDDSEHTSQARTADQASQAHKQLEAKQQSVQKQQAELQEKQAQTAAKLAAQQEAATAATKKRVSTAKPASAAKSPPAPEAAKPKETAKPVADAPKPETAQAPPKPAEPVKPDASSLHPISMPPPHYPVNALRAHIAGSVELEFTVAPDGSVTSAQVTKSQPAHVFDREAVNAIKHWRFEPVSAPVTGHRTMTFKPE